MLADCGCLAGMVERRSVINIWDDGEGRERFQCMVCGLFVSDSEDAERGYSRRHAGNVESVDWKFADMGYKVEKL